MFYLSGSGTVGNAKTDSEDEFGWYLGSHEKIEDKIYDYSQNYVRTPLKKNFIRSIESTPTIKKLSSLGSTNSHTDSDDPESYAIDEDFAKIDNGVDDSGLLEHIEMRSFERATDIDLEMIENDGNGVCALMRSSPSDCDDGFLKIDEKSVNENRRTICYTPERLVRCQEYRILTHSPIFLAIPRSTLHGVGDITPRRYPGHRRRHAEINDATEDPVPNRPRFNFRNGIAGKNNFEHHVEIGSRKSHVSSNRDGLVDIQSVDRRSARSTFGRANNGRDCGTKIVRPLPRDISGIRDNEWTKHGNSDHSTAVCLCDELTTAPWSSDNATESSNRTKATSEVTILKDLKENPATDRLGADDSCETNPDHDRITRLALAIESNVTVPRIVDDTDSLLIKLRDKVERLQETSRNIFKDIDRLRADFKYNESKVDDLTDGTVTLRQNINEIRYLDDLLNLLDGELERITRRDWPFVFGHSEHRTDDMNLVV